LRVVLDTSILKLATFPADNNASALIYELARAGLIEAWVSPAILEEYADVLGDHPELVADIVENFPVCYPLTELSVVRHEPDNRFLSTRPRLRVDCDVDCDITRSTWRRAWTALPVVSDGGDAFDCNGSSAAAA
jgi:predicted nucleic acid-binding protein